jgi:hypothetical protein
MRSRRATKTPFLGLLFLFGCQVCSAQQSSTPNPTSPTQKGTAIGQTINAAITAALPAASAIENVIAAIFKKPTGSSVSPTTTAKVSAKDVTDAVKRNVDPATLAAASQAQLAALQGAIEEIATVNILARNAQTAGASLTASRALLATSDWNDFKEQWEVAKKTLAKVTSMDPSKLGKISDENLLVDWNRLNSDYDQWIANVDNYSARKNLTLTLASFDSLYAAVQSLSQIPSVELQLISGQLQSVKAQPSSPTSGLPPPTPETTSVTLSGFITDTLPTQK